VKAKINGLSSEFVFEAARAGNIWFTGIDCNEAIINGKRTKISNGGGQTHYALQIFPNILKSAPNEKQKNFQWTGKEYSTAPIVPAFKKALQDLFKKGELTQSFMKAIGYNMERVEEDNGKLREARYFLYGQDRNNAYDIDAGAPLWDKKKYLVKEFYASTEEKAKEFLKNERKKIPRGYDRKPEVNAMPA
jgi:hypothetical protein